MEAATSIPQKLFFRIGEVCDLIKVQPHVLRYWETEFPMLSPQKNRAGQRVYRRKDVEMVLRIRNLLYEEKFTIAGARKKIAEELRKGGAPRIKMTAREAATDIEPSTSEANEKLSEERPLEHPPAQTASALPVPSTSLSNSVSSEVALSSTGPEPVASVKTQRAIRVLKHNLEELLTLLNSNASIKHSTQ